MNTEQIHQVTTPLIKEYLEKEHRNRFLSLVFDKAKYSTLVSITGDLAAMCTKEFNTTPLVTNDYKAILDLSIEQTEKPKIIIAYPAPLDDEDADVGSNTRHMRRGLNNMRLMKALAELPTPILVILINGCQYDELKQPHLRRLDFGEQSFYLSSVVKLFTEDKVLTLRDNKI